LNTPTIERVFGSVDRIAPVSDESISSARKFIEQGLIATGKLSDLETTFRGTTKRLSLRIATGLLNTLASNAGLPSPRLREILSSLTDQWPDLLKAVDELKPHLEAIAEKLDVALEVK